jgi:hypothetical protein
VSQRINGGNAACFYLKDWTGTGNHGFQNINNWKLNGETFSSDQQSPNGSNANDIKLANAIKNKIDGGVYIYIPSHNTQPNISGGGANFVTGSLPYCKGGPAPTLTCALGTMSVMEGVAIDISEKLSCSDGTAPTAPISLGGVNLANPVVGGPHSNLTAGAKCGGANGLPVTATCSGTLQVVDMSQACTGQRDLETYCPGANWNDVLWNVAPRSPVSFPSVSNSRIPAGCFWVENWNTSFGNNFGSNNSVKFRVNGEEFTGDQQQPNTNNANNTKLRTALNTKVDGGIYIWVEPAGTATATNNGVTYKAYSVATNNFADGALIAGTSQPFCVDGVHRLNCPAISPAQVTAGTAVTAPVPTCRSGEAPAITGWTNAPNWASPAEGTYNVSVAGSCGNSGPLTGSCGSLAVLAAGSTINVTLNHDASYSFEVGKTYNLTCQSSPRNLYCGPASGTVTITMGSITATVPTTHNGSVGTCTNGLVTVTGNISCTHKY